MPRHNFARPTGQLVELTLESAALRANLLGDPSERTTAVYLPRGYEESDEDYPLFVCLAGFLGSGLSHLGFKTFGESLPQRLDRLVREEKMGPVVMAFPDCFTSLGGNQYVNSASIGHWADYLVDELIPALQTRFRIRRGREHRAVFGKSSGGYGSMAHGMRHAHAWGAVACHSGDMAFEWGYLPHMPETLNVLARHDRSIETFLDHMEGTLKNRGEELEALMNLAMAATYDPDPGSFKGIRLPVDLETGELDEQAWQRWLRHDPIRMIREAPVQENLRSLQGLYIDCGSRDQYHLHYGSRVLVRELQAADIPHRYEEFDDNHSGIDYRMDVSLPYLYESLTR